LQLQHLLVALSSVELWLSYILALCLCEIVCKPFQIASNYNGQGFKNDLLRHSSFSRLLLRAEAP
jgi:hypothetical protein